MQESSLEVAVQHPTFEAWWEPYTLGVGPAGAYLADIDEERQAAIRDRCRQALGSGPFVITARAWSARGVA